MGRTKKRERERGKKTEENSFAILLGRSFRFDTNDTVYLSINERSIDKLSIEKDGRRSEKVAKGERVGELEI